MKKQALALGLAMTMLIQPYFAPASFAADTPTAKSTDTAEPTAEGSVSYTHTVSEAGIELLKDFEGYRRYPYEDYSQYSFGYGAYTEIEYDEDGDPKLDENGNYIAVGYPDGISEREASEKLAVMAQEYVVYLNRFLETNKIVLNQNQFDALASFSYNLGKYIWNKDSTLCDMLKSGEFLTDKEAFIEVYTDYCHAGGKVHEGLLKRRQREMTIFYAPESMTDPNADLYVVNASSLYVRAEPNSNAEKLGSISNTQVIRVHRYSEDGLWAYTSYCGFYGWVNMGYLIGINEAEMVTQVDTDGKDDQGIYYTFDDLSMTAGVGSSDAGKNTSGYAGEYAGEVYLTKYLLYKGSIYTLTAISDSAFTKCQSINSIYIPSCVTEIGNNAFADSTLYEILYTAGSHAEVWAKNSDFIATDYRCRAGHSNASWIIVQKATDSKNQLEERACSICSETQVRSYARIEIVKYPAKIEYKQDEAFSADGLAVEVIYTDGTRKEVTDLTFENADTSKLGKQTVTVKYSIFTADYQIEVSEKSLIGITVTKKPSKLTYIEGNKLSIDGMTVKANYDSGSSSTVTEYSVSGYDPNKIGKQTITVTYNGFTAAFEVTVKAKSLTAFSIKAYPEKLEYFCGEKFDPTGMKLKLSFDNGTVEEVSTGYTISGYDPDKAGTQKVKVKYGDITHTIQVVVILNYLSSDEFMPENGIVTMTKQFMTVSELTAAFDSGDRVEVLREGKRLPADSMVGTGMTIRLRYNDQIQDEATLIIVGDLTGDGRCSVSDFVALSDYFVESITLSDTALAAADVNGDRKVDLIDYVQLYSMSSNEVILSHASSS